MSGVLAEGDEGDEGEGDRVGGRELLLGLMRLLSAASTNSTVNT